ncbi:MAG: hypothetical protein JWM55_251, partial [Acidimicrobiaceae bacterium]|nr:hypothetical protein [Acidimicrobiaceae bacterium]
RISDEGNQERHGGEVVFVQLAHSKP